MAQGFYACFRLRCLEVKRLAHLQGAAWVGLGSCSVYATELPKDFRGGMTPTVYMPASNVLQLQKVVHT